LPNTYYAKTPNYLDGLHYVWKTLGTGWAGVLVMLGLLGAILGRREHLGFFVAGLSWIPAMILEGGDWMPFGRMILPALILFCLSAAGIAEARNKVNGKIFHAALALLLIAVSAFLYMATRHQQKVEFVSEYSIVHDGRLMSTWLKTNNIHSVALLDIGEIGFRTNANVFDLAGLVDKKIAKSKGGFLSKTFDIRYLTDVRKPEAVIIRLSAPLELDHGISVTSYAKVEQHLLSSQVFYQHYSPYLAIEPGYKRVPYYGHLIFLRNGFKIDDKFVHYYSRENPQGLYVYKVPISKRFIAVMQ